MTHPTLYKNVRFDSLPVNAMGFCDALGKTLEKISPRKARSWVADEPSVVIDVKGSLVVRVADQDGMARRAAFLARPLYDGTEASCRSREDYYRLDAALREVRSAMEKLDEMADYVTRKMGDIKRHLRRDGVVELPRAQRWDPVFSVPPASVTSYCGLNSCGELQGNGNVDMLVAALLAKREAFAMLVDVLGYRLTDEWKEGR